MLVSKILAAVAKILIGDVAGCYNNLRKGIEPYTNSARITSLIVGGTVGVLLTTFVLTHLLSYLITTVTGDSLSNFETISLNITDGSIGIMLGSRILDFIVAKMVLPLYYYCKYGNSRELYKTFSNKELRLIHDNIATQPGCELLTVMELEQSIKNEGYSQLQIEEIIETKLSGTLGLLNGIRKQIIAYKDHAKDPELINNHWLLLRLGKVQDLCLQGDSYVKNILMERFDLPTLSGRRLSYTIAVNEEKSMPCDEKNTLSQVTQATSSNLRNSTIGCALRTELAESKNSNFFKPSPAPDRIVQIANVELMRLE